MGKYFTFPFFVQKNHPRASEDGLLRGRKVCIFDNTHDKYVHITTYMSWFVMWCMAYPILIAQRDLRTISICIKWVSCF